MKNIISVSLCMIVKNEELVLKRCLNSIKEFVDEIIIVDTGSSDNTKKIAQNFTKNIYDFEWVNDFSSARNFAFSKATSNYIMWLDADDVVPQRTLQTLLKIKNSLTADTYMMKYEIPINSKNKFSFYRERILKNCNLAKWNGAVHECIVPFGKIEYIQSPVIHKKERVSDPNRNLNIYEITAKTRELSPREKYYYGRELFDSKQYNKTIRILTDFSKNPTCKENLIDAYLLISKCYEILNKIPKQIEFLLKTFEIDTPNAEVCCKMGDYFLKLKNYNVANYWYKQATKSKKNENSLAFVNDIYYGYYPYLQMCVSFYNLNDLKNANIYNEKAGKILESNVVKYNREVLNKNK